MGWLKKLLTKKVIKKTTGSVVRTVLVFLAGFLAAKGAPAELVEELKNPQTQEFWTGIITFAVVQLWSLAEKATK